MNLSKGSVPNSMLADVIGNYIDSLTEREFDAPFIALLRLHGFTDIHFLHGSFEFGKDFIAKRKEGELDYQYTFQTKAGDLGLSAWKECRGQIDMLRVNSLAHPNFDKLMPRKARFVTTGRLVGGATLDAQEYREHLARLQESEFIAWDRDTLVEMISVDPLSLSGSPLSLLQILGTAGTDLDFEILEAHSRGWIRSGESPTNLRDGLESAVIASHCRMQKRIDLACAVALMSLRSTFATAHGAIPLPDTLAILADAGHAMFRHYAGQLWEQCRGRFLEPDELIQEDRSPAGFLTYPVRCLTLIETLGLLGLLLEQDNPTLSTEVAEYLAGFLQANTGAAHPVSDRWAVSLAPTSLLLARHGKSDVVHNFLLSVTTWIANRYDEGNLGLAGPYASPADEANRLLGSAFEHVALQRRSESYTASLILDLASVLEDGDLYNMARNEFLAVNAVLPILEVDDDISQYGLHLGQSHFEPNMPYDDYWAPQETWRSAPHHKRGAPLRYLERIGSPWDQVALSSVLRDRHFVYTWRRILGKTL
jgi:hypothetical protein